MKTAHHTDPSVADCAGLFGLDGLWLETAPGERTHYHDVGSGPALTLLHGSGPGVSAAANWWRNIAPLAADHRVVAHDLVGFGRTMPADEARYGIDVWVDQTLRVLDALDIDRTWLVGNSLGGWVAFQLAIDHPDRVAGLVSMGTGGAPRKAATPAPPGEHAGRGRMRDTLSAFVVDQDLLTDELIEARSSLAARPGAEARFNAALAARDHDRQHHPLDPDALSRIDKPVLLVHGREDRIIPMSRSWDLLHVIPGADLYVMARCGHWTQIERADEFNRIVADFVDMHDPGR